MFCRILFMLVLIYSTCFTDQPYLFAQSKTAHTSLEESQVFVPGEIVIKVQPNATIDHIIDLNASNGAKIVEEISSLRLYRLKVSAPVGEATISYQSNPAVEHAQPNYIFAIIGKEYITLFDLESTIHRMIPLLRQRYRQMQAKQNLLRSLLKDKIFFQAAKDEDLQSIPEVQRELNEAVAKALARIYQKRIRTDTSVITEKEMMASYEKNIQRYQTPEQIKGQIIVVRNKREAEEVLERIKAGTDFSDLARERSIGPNRQKGGAFGWLGRGRMPSTVEKVAFTLQKGEISEIIATQSGYYIVKIEDKKAPKDMPFSEVEKQIKRRLATAKRKEAIERKTKELEEKYNVRLNLEFLSEVKIPEEDKIDLQDADSLQMLREVIKKAIERPF